MPAIAPTAIVVSRDSFDSDDAYALIQSNISFINAQLDQWLRPDEIAADAMCSYYVDFYVAQVNNGGFAQFVDRLANDRNRRRCHCCPRCIVEGNKR